MDLEHLERVLNAILDDRFKKHALVPLVIRAAAHGWEAEIAVENPQSSRRTTYAGAADDLETTLEDLTVRVALDQREPE